MPAIRGVTFITIDNQCWCDESEAKKPTSPVIAFRSCVLNNISSPKPTTIAAITAATASLNASTTPKTGILTESPFPAFQPTNINDINVCPSRTIYLTSEVQGIIHSPAISPVSIYPNYRLCKLKLQFPNKGEFRISSIGKIDIEPGYQCVDYVKVSANDGDDGRYSSGKLCGNKDITTQKVTTQAVTVKFVYDQNNNQQKGFKFQFYHGVGVCRRLEESNARQTCYLKEIEDKSRTLSDWWKDNQKWALPVIIIVFIIFVIVVIYVSSRQQKYQTPQVPDDLNLEVAAPLMERRNLDPSSTDPELGPTEDEPEPQSSTGLLASQSSTETPQSSGGLPNKMMIQPSPQPSAPAYPPQPYVPAYPQPSFPGGDPPTPTAPSLHDLAPPSDLPPPPNLPPPPSYENCV